MEPKVNHHWPAYTQVGENQYRKLPVEDCDDDCWDVRKTFGLRVGNLANDDQSSFSAMAYAEGGPDFSISDRWILQPKIGVGIGGYSKGVFFDRNIGINARMAFDKKDYGTGFIFGSAVGVSDAFPETYWEARIGVQWQPLHFTVDYRHGFSGQGAGAFITIAYTLDGKY